MSSQREMTKEHLREFRIGRKGTNDRALFVIWVLCGAVLGSLLSVGATGVRAQTVDSSLAKQRAKHLQRGINLSDWFAQVYDPKGYTKEHFETWTTAQDIALIKTMGFDHVRLTVNPKPMWRQNATDQFPEEYLGYLTRPSR